MRIVAFAVVVVVVIWRIAVAAEVCGMYLHTRVELGHEFTIRCPVFRV